MNQEQSVKELKKNLECNKERCFKLEEELKLLKSDKHSLETDSEQQLYLLKQVLTIVIHRDQLINTRNFYVYLCIKPVIDLKILL